MKESYRKGVANHPDPESCLASRKAAIEALTGAHAGWALSCEIIATRVPTSFNMAEGNTGGCALASIRRTLRSQETPGMHGNSMRENRETPSTPVGEDAAGRLEKALSPKSNMHVGGESDDRIVPAKCPNNGEQAPAEGMEGRRSTKENIEKATPPRTQSRTSELSDLLGVREVAGRDKRTRFTALLHHVTTKLLRDSYYALKRDAAPGVDGVTWQEYETDLNEKLADLHRRIHRGTYRAQPSRRAYISKADGRQRPLGIAALEDKIVQHAVVTVLNQIYEEDFLGFSYGFRPERSQHHALDALWVGIMRKKVNWILDADIRGFFDNRSHEWLVRFIEHRVAPRPEDSAPSPKVAAGGSLRGGGMVEDGSRDPTRISSIAATGQHLPALRIRSVGQALAKASRHG